MIKTYVESPKRVTAIQLLDHEDFSAALKWMRDNGQEVSSVVLDANLIHQSYLVLHRGEGARLHINWGEWVVMDDVGVFWRVEPELFSRLYTPRDS